MQLYSACFALICSVALPCIVQAQAQTPRSVEAAFEVAGDNQAEIKQAWERVAEEERVGLKFLLEHMPASDLKTLTGEYLLENVTLAYKAKREAPWGKDIPEEIFLNEVLPYASVNERRDAWRKEFNERFAKHVKDVTSPGLAAAKLNQAIFAELNVKYSTKRRRADQGPRESMESGLASCTGLTILLIDACRAVGVPARFVGTPLWTDNSGNHSWVEVWDGDWHFTGSAEATGDELDKAWFVDRASTALVDDPKHAIFATSFRTTPIQFPMVWARDNNDVSAINVTERYLKKSKSIPDGFVLMRVKTLGTSGLDRCRANVVVRDQAGNVVFRGQSKDESFDANDHLTIEVRKGQELQIEMQSDGATVTKKVVASEDGKLVTLNAAAGEKTDAKGDKQSDAPKTDAPKTDEPKADEPKADDTTAKCGETSESTCAEPTPSKTAAIEGLQSYLKLPQAERGSIAEQPFAALPLSREESALALELLAADHLATIRKDRAAEMEEKTLKIGDFTMPFELKKFGDKPEAGHSVVISMHGGGGAPKRVNDQQWENQKRLYDLEEGIYVTPRAPTDTWNMWHQGHIDAFYTRLIENLIAIEGINPNRVYITGYSAGGDGVYQLAPRMADQLAAAAMMAGHPNETKPDGLRNLPFTLHVGGKDAAYNRNSIAENWTKMLGELKVADAGGYEHWAKVYPEKGHWMDREDREGVKWMFKYTRDFTPGKVIWLQDDVIHSRFYWLGVDPANAKAGDRIVASRKGNDIAVEAAAGAKLKILLRDDLVNLDEEVVVRQSDREIWRGKAMRTIATIHATLADRGDPTATFCSSVELAIE